MNPIIKYFAIAGILLLGACGSSGNNRDNFGASTFTVPQNITTRLLNTTSDGTISLDDQLENIGRDYLESISFDIPIDVDFTNFYLTGRGIDSLSVDDGIFMVGAFNNREIDSHIFVGILNTTNVGAPLAVDGNATVTFMGEYSHLLVLERDGGRKDPYYTGGNGFPITVTANFVAGDLVGFSTKNPTQDGEAVGEGIPQSIIVNGRFNGTDNVLSGSINISYDSIGRDFTVPLTGRIGVDGVVGVFVDHGDAGDGAGYAVGGGFVAGRNGR